MIDLKEKTDDIKELEIPEIKKENNEENIDNQQIVVTEKKSKKWIIISSLIIVIILLIFFISMLSPFNHSLVIITYGVILNQLNLLYYYHLNHLELKKHYH